MSRSRSVVLGFAGLGVLLAAVDTYVVVVALPSIMDGVGLTVNQIQRATPVVTAFLLGYVAVLPMLGRLSDELGHAPVFGSCLAIFAAGSLVTATAHTLGVLLLGRGVQGLGGGGLVPVALSMVAARWPADKRGLPLGVLGGLQELGSVLGPLYGAAIVAVAGWRWLFWINIPLSAVILAGFLLSGGSLHRPATAPSDQVLSGGSPLQAPVNGLTEPRGRTQRSPGRLDVIGIVLGALTLAGLYLALDRPDSLATSVSWAWLYRPALDNHDWGVFTTPMFFIALALLVVWASWEVLVPSGIRPLVPLRGLPAAIRRSDPIGSLLLAAFLACIVVAFSTTNPARQVIASSAVFLGPAAAIALVAFTWHQLRAKHPLLPPALFKARPAWGATLANLAVGAALMAALVNVPFFARSTVDPNSQLDAALVLLRFLAAVPMGAVVGGLICRRVALAKTTAVVGLVLSALAFTFMTSWQPSSLSRHLHPFGVDIGIHPSDIDLVVCGLGFGLAIAPINLSVLAGVPQRLHGVSTSMAVVARTVGMLAGISALTSIAIHRFYDAEAKIGSPFKLCPKTPGNCAAYNNATAQALVGEIHTIFAGAAVAAGLAALVALLTVTGIAQADARTSDSSEPAEATS